MAPTSTALYELENGYDIDDLKQRISDIVLERQTPELGDPIRSRFDEVTDTDTGFSSTIVFELPEKKSTWNGVEYQAVRKQVSLRFTDAIGNGGVLVIGKSDLHAKIESRLIDLFEIEPDEIDKVDIRTEHIESILEDDRLIESRATYKSVDENTSSASLAGALEESETAERFDEYGNKVWVIYESTSFERKVGISAKNSAVVFYGNWESDEMARYWRRIVLHHV